MNNALKYGTEKHIKNFCILFQGGEMYLDHMWYSHDKSIFRAAVQHKLSKQLSVKNALIVSQ